MPELEIKFAPNQIEFGPCKSWSDVPDDDPAWLEIRRRFLYFACEHRALCFLSDGIGGASIIEDLPNARKVSLPRRWYQFKRWIWLASSYDCPKTILDEIVNDTEFSIGLLFFTSIENTNSERCRHLVPPHQNDHAHRPREDKSEMLFAGCDGRLITWRNPPERLRFECEAVLQAIAKKLGWDVVLFHESN
jgi:hypothetical protein